MDSILKKLKQRKAPKIIQYIKNKRMKFHNWVKFSFEDSYRGVIAISILLSTAIAMGILHLVFPNMSGFVGAILGFIGVVILGELLGLFNKLVFGIKKRNRIYWFLQFFFIFLCAFIAAQAQHAGTNLIFALIEAVMVGIFGRCLWAMIKNKKHTVLIILSCIVTMAELITTAVFLKSEGFQDSYITRFFKMAEETTAGKKESFKISELGQESFETASAVYGIDDNSARTIDLTDFAKRRFPTKSSMKKHFGYELSNVPLQGKVWYPVNQKNCPVLFIIHGNHSYVADSYLGYDYLGEYLASCGYVTVSVNENSCNDLTNENDGRAVLLLENIKYVLSLNEDPTSEYYQRINADQIAIAGHSRGGEAVSEAYLFNDYDCYPDNGNLKFHYGFQIKSIIAIAPTVDQYRPAQREVELQNVNYLLIQGANDHDVSSAMGMKQYGNVTFTKDGDYLKSMLYVAGANHGQFNTEWGKYDLFYPVNDFINVANLLRKSDQEEILKHYVKNFLDVKVKGENTNQDLFKDYQKYSCDLPKTIYQQVYQTSEFQCIADFEEDSNLSSATMENASIETSNLKEWKEIRTVYGDGSTGENYALSAEWKDTKEAEIRFKTPELSLTGKSVVFDLADLSEDDKATSLIDGEVIVTDASGNTASTRISDHTIVYPSLPVKLRKLDYLFGDCEYKHQFQTVTVPDTAFTKDDPRVNLNQIVEVKIVFNSTDSGEIKMDNVGIE